MSKEQVTKVMGSNFQTVGAREGSQTGKVEVIRFSNDKEGELLAYFRDGRLVQWGDTTVLENLPN